MEARGRWRAIDALRGLVIVVMALDHVRDFLGRHDVEATDLAHTSVPLFASRWVTHFCAPTFFLLAGVSAYLSIRGGRRTRAEAARFLAVRGVALIVLEQTALRCFGWYFHFDYHFMNAGVLYGLGGAMVLLAGFVWLPPRVSLVAGLAIVLGEAAIAALPVDALAPILRSQDFEPVAGYHFFVSYPPIPWFGVMAFGYGLGEWVYAGAVPRRRVLVGLGAAFLAGFAVVRGLGLGDPWSAQPSATLTALAFVNVSKYPPSTAFLLLTLGGALLALAAFERWPRGAPLEVYGRVPLFFYVLHVPLIHGLAVIYSYAAFGAAPWLLAGPVIFWDTALPGSPPSYGFSLPAVWAIWLGFTAAMWPLCRWYGRLTASRAGRSAA